MRKVLIPLGEVKIPPESHYPLLSIRHTYIEKLKKNNVLTLLLPTNAPIEQLDEYLSMVDGVLFFGGSDINPKLYSQEKEAGTNPSEPMRDNLEFNLLQKVITNKIPFLGICRGMQMLNIVQGGTLFQEIPDSTNEIHRPIPQVYEKLIDGPFHEIQIDKSSKAYKILNKDTVTTNSGHHQCVNMLGADLRISGKSSGGVAEIIEHTDPNYFCFGIQGHPEAMENGDLDPFFAAIV